MKRPKRKAPKTKKGVFLRGEEVGQQKKFTNIDGKKGPHRTGEKKKRPQTGRKGGSNTCTIANPMEKKKNRKGALQ